MTRCLLTRMYLLMALAGAMIAGSAHGQAPAHRERMVQRVYSVADLVVPIDAVKAGMGAAPSVPAPPVVNRWVGPDGLERVGVNFREPQCQPKPVAGCCAKSGPATPATCEGQLIKLLQTTVAPKTWTTAGGAGSIEYNPTSMALVVHQTPAIQDQVDELLSSLRQLQDVQVAMNIQIVSISDSMFEHMAQEFDLNLQPSKLLDGDTVAKILDAFQGDRRTCVLQAPKVTTFNGQEARVVCGDERFFITGMKAQRHNGQLVLIPQNERFSTGSNITVQPTVTPDNRNVVVKFHAEVSEMPDATVPLFPVTTFVTPVFEGGAQGQPIPFTQFIQQPTVVTRGVTKVFGIPDGKTGFIYGGRCSHTVKHVNRVPVLGDLPLLGDLFTSESQSVESNHLIFLVTPKVVLTGDASERAAVGPPCEDRKPYVGLMPTQAPMAVVEAAHCCIAPAKMAETTCANPPCCEQCPKGCTKEKCPTACCTATPTSCPLCTQSCPAEKCPTACCTTAPACCPSCSKSCQTEKCPGGCCAAPKTVCPPCTQPCTSASTPVSIKANILIVGEGFFARFESGAWSDLSPKSCDGQVKILDANLANRFSRSLVAQNAGKLLADPQLRVGNGESASFLAGGWHESMSGVDFVARDGVTVPEVRNTRQSLGFNLLVVPHLSADQQTCRLDVCTGYSHPSNDVAIPAEVTISSRNTINGVESTRTLEVRPAALNVQNNSFSASVPLGQSALYYFCTENANEGKKYYAVILTPESCQPVPPAGPPQVLQTSVELVPEPTPVVEAQPANESLRKLLAKYQRACAEGRTKDAKKLAGKCLAIDPKCFGRDE